MFLNSYSLNCPISGGCIFIDLRMSSFAENLKVHLQTTEQLLNELEVRLDKEYSKSLAENKEFGVTVANTDTEIKMYWCTIFFQFV